MSFLSSAVLNLLWINGLIVLSSPYTLIMVVTFLHSKTFSFAWNFHLTTPPHTPEHNDFSAHRHHHIVEAHHVVETSLALLHHASVSTQFWPFAFATVVNFLHSKTFFVCMEFFTKPPLLTLMSIMTSLNVVVVMLSKLALRFYTMRPSLPSFGHLPLPRQSTFPTSHPSKVFPCNTKSFQASHLVVFVILGFVFHTNLRNALSPVFTLVTPYPKCLSVS